MKILADPSKPTHICLVTMLDGRKSYAVAHGPFPDEAAAHTYLGEIARYFVDNWDVEGGSAGMADQEAIDFVNNTGDYFLEVGTLNPPSDPKGWI